MLFPTVEYALFFLVVLAVSWALAPRLNLHKLFLLAASYIFYGFWSWEFVPLLVAVSLFAFLIAKGIQRTEDGSKRKWLLGCGIAVCLVVLAYYKYISFVMLSALDFWGMFGRVPQWKIPAPLLPLGICVLHVSRDFVDVSDIYRRKLQQPLTALDALLYIAFFPQLIAGPILRASRFIPQLAHRRNPGCGFGN